MPSAWIEKREVASGTRYLVKYRLGGRESARRYAGSFATRREALARCRWVAAELSAMRVPDLRLIDARSQAPTVAEAAERWRRSRIDVSAGTAATYRVNLGRILARLGPRRVEEATPAEVAELAGDLAESELARESIRKTLVTFVMVLDFAGVVPNPVRDKAVKLPHELRHEINPPTAEHVLAVLRLVPSKYRLPLLVLDATGMRVGELEQLTWGDIDEPAVAGGSRRPWRKRDARAGSRFPTRSSERFSRCGRERTAWPGRPSLSV